MTYEYQCTADTCRALIEKIQVRSADRAETIPCPHCGGTADFKISATAISRAGMTNQPFDVAVGRDSEHRWATLREQQANRDKIRRESQQVGLAATGFNTFKPISEEQRQKRTAATQTVGRVGYGRVLED